MRKDFSVHNDKITEYVWDLLQLEDPELKSIRERAEKNALPPIHVSAFDGRHLQILTAAAQAQKVVEIGTLGGYSGLCFLRGMRPNGKLYTFELDQKHADFAAETFRLAGASDQVEILIGPAMENLQKIEKHGPFDIVFIDADKRGYPAYAQWAAENLRKGGIIIGDNTFAFGHIADEAIDDRHLKKQVEALREFNSWLSNSGNFLTTMIPTGEGLTVAVKI